MFWNHKSKVTRSRLQFVKDSVDIHLNVERNKNNVRGLYYFFFYLIFKVNSLFRLISFAPINGLLFFFLFLFTLLWPVRSQSVNVTFGTVLTSWLCLTLIILFNINHLFAHWSCCTKLNHQTVLFLTIQFSISHLFAHYLNVWPIDRTLSGATISG